MPPYERLHVVHRHVVEATVRLLTPRRLRLYPALAAAALLGGWLTAVVLAPALDGRAGRLLWPDFVAFYSAGGLFLEGRLAEVYDVGVQRAFQRELVAPAPLRAVNLFLNPPFAALFFAPFAALPFLPALGLWWAAGLGALVLSLGWLRRELRPRQPAGLAALLGAALVFPPTLAWLVYAQSSPFSLLLLTAAFVLLRRGRDGAAGFALAALAWKPQLALALAAVLVVRLRVRALAGGALGLALWLGLSWWLSPEATRTWLALAPELGGVLRHEGYPAWGLASLFGLCVLLFDGGLPAATVPVATGLTAAALAALLVLWRRLPWRPGTPAFDLAMAGTLASGCLLSPHLYHYDLLLLLLPLAIVVARVPGAGDRPLDGSTLLAWTALLVVSTAVGPPLTRAQLALAGDLALAPVALQLPVLAVAVWGALVLARARSLAVAGAVSAASPSPRDPGDRASS